MRNKKYTRKRVCTLIQQALYLQATEHFEMRQHTPSQRMQFITTFESRYDAAMRVFFSDTF